MGGTGNYFYIYIWAAEGPQMCQFEGSVDLSKPNQRACFTGSLSNTGPNQAAWARQEVFGQSNVWKSRPGRLDAS